MKLPTQKEALQLFEKYKVPHNIFIHCKKVCQVGTLLAKKLNQAGVDINIELTSRACLLHDLMKAIVFEELKEIPHVKSFPTEEEKVMHKQLREQYKGMHETEAQYEILKDDYPELAKIMKGTKTENGEHDIENMSWEEKIEWYSDWRCFVDEILTLDERIEEAFQRKKMKISKDFPRWTREINNAKKVEEEIFSYLDFSPDALKEKVLKESEEL